MDADAVEKLAGAIAIANKAVKEAAARGEKRRRAGQAGRQASSTRLFHRPPFKLFFFFLFSPTTLAFLRSTRSVSTSSNHTKKKRKKYIVFFVSLRCNGTTDFVSLGGSTVEQRRACGASIRSKISDTNTYGPADYPRAISARKQLQAHRRLWPTQPKEAVSPFRFRRPR